MANVHIKDALAGKPRHRTFEEFLTSREGEKAMLIGFAICALIVVQVAIRITGWLVRAKWQQLESSSQLSA